MTFHKAQHKGVTIHKGNRRPCPQCGRNMRKVYDSSKVTKVLSRVVSSGCMYFCSFCGIKGMKKDYRLERATK
jgi:hypothetical protein